MRTTPEPALLRKDRNGCAVLTLNRPHKLNAIDDALLAALEAELERLEYDTSRTFVLTGRGRAFCAGTDLEHAEGDAEARIKRMHRLVLRLQRHAKPSVAALNGLALGGGLELAAACTFRIAAPDAKLGLPEVKLGLMPLYGGTALLPRLIGANRSLELMLSGEPVSAYMAERWSLVNRVSSSDHALLDEAVAFATGIGQHSRIAVQALRQLHDAAHNPATLEQGLDAELAAGRAVITSADAAEGLAAFLARRPPVFRDR